MRRLYYPTFTYEVHLKSGETYSTKEDFKMRYEDIGNRKMVNMTYTMNDLQQLIDDKIVWCEKSLFKNKTYIRLRIRYEDRWFNVRDVDHIVVTESCEEVDKTTSIEYIGCRLPYDEFMQLVFDKEQELKSVITSRRVL